MCATGALSAPGGFFLDEVLERDSLVSQHLMSPQVINPYSYSLFCSTKICELDGELCYREFCYHKAFGAPKRVFPRLADNTDNMQSQDKH